MSFSPNLGRWITEDPIDFAGEDNNFYRMVENCPTNFTDPDGLKKDDWRTYVYPFFAGPAVGIELLGGQAPTPQAVAVGYTYAGPVSASLPHMAARQFWAWVADTKMQANGMPLSAALLHHSIGPAPTYHINPGHFAYGTIQNSSDLKADVDKIVHAAPVGVSQGTTSGEFKTGDLYIALHFVNLTYRLFKNNNDSYAITVDVQDTYNFERNIQGILTQSLNVWAGANAAWLSQYVAVIREFEVTAGPFHFSRGLVMAV